jgi:shikimate 5-dehydrogenase
MFWVVNDWALAIKALDCLKADDSAIVTVGTDIIGTVGHIRAKHSKVTKT